MLSLFICIPLHSFPNNLLHYRAKSAWLLPRKNKSTPVNYFPCIAAGHTVESPATSEQVMAEYERCGGVGWTQIIPTPTMDMRVPQV